MNRFSSSHELAKYLLSLDDQDIGFGVNSYEDDESKFSITDGVIVNDYKNHLVIEEDPCGKFLYEGEWS